MTLKALIPFLLSIPLVAQIAPYQINPGTNGQTLQTVGGVTAWGTGGSGLPAGCTSSGTGNITCTGVVTAQSVNGALNPLLAPGATIDAQVAWLQANVCVSGESCYIVLPSITATQTFTTGMILTDNQVFRCSAQMGTSARETGTTTPMNLYYNGTGVGITLSGANSRFENCGYQLGTSVGTGVLMSGHSSRVTDNYFRDGGTGTTLIHISGGSAHGSLVEDARAEGNKIFGYIGTAISIDHANDPQLYRNVAYGINGNVTARPLVVDSEAQGLIVSSYISSDAGLGWIFRHTFGGANFAPQWVFLSQIQSDCSSGGDAITLDATLGTNQINLSMDDSWPSGAGSNCTGGVVTPTGNGVHISGGQVISIGPNVRLRANTANGILIDSVNVAHVKIINNQINGNNWGPTSNGTYSGITVSAMNSDLLIEGNSCDNTIEGTFGGQKYCVNLLSSGPQQRVVNNSCTSSVTACWNSWSGAVDAQNNQGSDASGDAQVAFTNLPPYGFRLTPKADTGDNIFCISNAANSTCVTSITRDGNASFAKNISIGSNIVLPSTLTGYHGNSAGTKVQLSDGTGASGNCAKFDANGNITDAGAVCAGGTGLTVVQTNGTNNASMTGLNFITSTVNAAGLTITPSNPATTSEKMEITGTYSGTISSGQVTAGLGYTPQTALTNPVTGPGSGATVGHLAVMNATSGDVIADGGVVPTSFPGFGTSGSTAAVGNDSRITGAVQSGGALGTPASGVITNLTGTCTSCSIGGNAATATSATSATSATTAATATALAAQAADTVVMNATGGSAAPTAVAMPTSGTNGCAGSSDALIYNTSTHALGCNTISGGGGGTPSYPVTVAGTVTSGGIPYFSNTTTETSSGILNSNILVKGGGAGGAPTNSSITDNGTSIIAAEPFTSSAVGNVPLTINGFSSGQTADLLDVYKYSGGPSALSLTPSGVLTIGNAAGTVGGSIALGPSSGGGGGSSFGMISNGYYSGLILVGGPAYTFGGVNTVANVTMSGGLYTSSVNANSPIMNGVDVSLPLGSYTAGNLTSPWTVMNLRSTLGNGTNVTYTAATPMSVLGLNPTINVNTGSTSGYTEIYSKPVETSKSATATNYFIQHFPSGGSTANFSVAQDGSEVAKNWTPSTIFSAAGTALPTCAAGIKGMQAVVSDATVPLYMTAYASGGTITTAVICSYNGTTYSWLTH
jgi:hypothetical protein